LNKAGFHVFAGCLFPEGDGAKKLERSAFYPNRLTVIGLDITRDSDIEQLYNRVREHCQGEAGDKLWALVNNAGILRLGELEWGSFDHTFQSVIEVNTMGAVKMTRKFLPLLRESKGRLVNVASVAGRISAPTMVSYSMSKYAIVAFTEGLRREVAKFGVKVSSIEPFIFATRLATKEYMDSLLDMCWETTPQEARDSYGERYFRGFKKRSWFISKWMTNSGPEAVVEAILDAIRSPEPLFTYTVASLLTRPVLWLTRSVPQEWFDIGFHWFMRLSKGDKPQIQAKIGSKSG
jgi:NAD(P)-dependent dehydrogenase (short-subunit alcohol dehydrogenase family)